jgi:hypothetical protein
MFLVNASTGNPRVEERSMKRNAPLIKTRRLFSLLFAPLLRFVLDKNLVVLVG